MNSLALLLRVISDSISYRFDSNGLEADMRIAPLLQSSFLLAAVSLLAPIAAQADGGGGGGNIPRGESPSLSAPSFNPAAEYAKAVEALKSNRFAEAKKSLARVLSVAPRDANTNYLAGLAAVGLNDLKSAQRYFDRAIKADKNLIIARQDLAVTLIKLGERAKAEVELAKLKESQAKCGSSCPQAADLESAITAVTAALGQGSQAQLQTRPGLLFESAKLGDTAYLTAVGLINEGRYDAAIEELKKASITFGPHPDILTYLGFANRKMKRYELAETYYRQALAAAPDHRGATEYYGELMVERGDLKGAKQMLAKLDARCSFGCAEADELRRWIDAKRAPTS